MQIASKEFLILVVYIFILLFYFAFKKLDLYSNQVQYISNTTQDTQFDDNFNQTTFFLKTTPSNPQKQNTIRKAGALRDVLARLPGPVMRPAQPGAAQMNGADLAPPVAIPAVPAINAAPRFMLPVQGRLVAGFGARAPGGLTSRGIALAAGAGAQAISPAAGRVSFAGPYRGYGMIVIIDHGGGWTSLVTGLGQTDVRVGEQLVAGSPLGIAGPGRPIVSLELRRDGQPVNPLDFAKLG